MSTDKRARRKELIIPTVCRSHCGGACLLKVHVKDGIITRIETDDGPEHQYRACARGRAYRQRVYAADRLKYPMKRIGERGSGEFTRISWDEALSTVASEIKRVKKTYGSSAVSFMCSSGDIHWLNNPALIEKVLVRYGGYSGVWGTTSQEAQRFAGMATYGIEADGHTRDDWLNSRLIILWGCNPTDSGGYGDPCRYLQLAKKRGTRIISIDPRYTDTAATFANQWIPIIPNTDAAMLIAMAYVVITENLLDQAFIDRFTYGFNIYKEYVLGKEDGVPKTPDWAEKITGVPANTTAGLAREYATLKPAALMDGMAPGRTAYGEQYHRAAAILAAITGNIGITGGFASSLSCQSFPWLQLGPPLGTRLNGPSNPVDDSFPPRKDPVFYQQKDQSNLTVADYYSGGASSARVNRLLLADAILKGRSGGYPVDYKLLYLANINYVNQYANTNKIVEALKKLEFIVIQEQLMTATARYADIILPVNTFLERDDLTTGAVGPYYGCVNKTIASIGESKSHFEIAAGLAEKLGIGALSEKTIEEWRREIVVDCKDIPDYDSFKRDGIYKMKCSRPYVAFEKNIKDLENNPFPTPSGKIEIYSQHLADMNNPLIPPVPKYIEAWEGHHDSLAKKYPLQLITIHTKRRAHSQFNEVPWLQELYPHAISIHSTDAEARGIKTGDTVRVFNDRGEIVIRAIVTERVMPGVVDLPQGAWYDPDKNGVDRGGCANVLSKDVISPGGAFCTNTALVQIEKS